MAGSDNITAPDRDVDSIQVDDKPPVRMAPYGGYGMPESFGGIPSAGAFAPNLSPSPQSDFMSDIDVRGARVQSDLVGPAKEAREYQSWAGQQLRDNTTQDIRRQEDAWSRERARADDPALRPWNADTERAARTRGPMEQFGSIGMIFAMAASAFTRTPMTSALNAGAAAMTAIQQGDEKAYESAYKAWKDNSDLALRRFDMEHRLYEDANQLLTSDMNLWKTKTLQIAAQFDDQKKIAMLQNGMDPEVLKAQEAAAESAIRVRKAQQGFQEFEDQRTMIKEGIQALRQVHKDWKDDNKGPEQMAAEAQVYARAVRASKGLESREPTGIQEFTSRWWAEHPDGTAEEFSDAFGKFMQGQKLPAAASGRVTESMDRVQRIQEMTKQIQESGEEPDYGKAHELAAKRVLEADSKARQAGKSPMDQALVNVLDKYPGMKREDLGTIQTQRQPKVIAAVIESPENLEAIAKFTKENPNALGLIAEASKRVNLDAYQGLFSSWSTSKTPKDVQAQLESKIARDREAAIDKVAQERKLDLTQAANAKILQKMLTTQAFTDAALAGSRGATIYLDKAFREIYDPNASPGAFFSILEKRYDEADRVAREYKLGFNDRSPEALAEMPFWTGKAAGYAGTLVEKPPVPGAVHAKDGWYVETTPDAPGARKAKNGKWYSKVP
jgi:hypothetical protein